MERENRTEVIASKLRAAAQRRLRPFGVEGHGFELLPVVRVSEMRAFEALHGITLPEEYRTFVMRVGRGGAGPAYGMIPFEQILWPERSPLPAGFLATPFPFESAFQPEPLPEDNDEADERSLRERSGTVVLCHEGCGYYHFLVCSGSARDQMWIDNSVSEGPYAPLGVGFLDWYERWLDDVIAGGDGAWWQHSPSDRDSAFEDALRTVKPWWIRWARRRGRD